MLNIINTENKIIDSRDWKFCRRNINRLVFEYDAELKFYHKDIKSATMKDKLGRMIWIEWRR